MQLPHRHWRHLPRRALVGLLDVYRATLSPDHGWTRHLFPYGFCPQHPTCSSFARETLLRHGAWRGFWLAAGRVLRCHPWRQPDAARWQELAKR